MKTTITGDYPRTPNAPRRARLRSAIAKLDKGKINVDDLKKVQDEVTIEVMTELREAGVDLLTDGMIRWDDAQTYFAGALEGIEITGLIRYFDTNTYFRQQRVHNNLCWNKPITVDDYRFAAEHAGGKTKAVLTGPYTLARLSHDDFYKDIYHLTEAYASCLNEEMKALQDAGCEHIAINDPALVFLGGEVEAFFDALPALLNGIHVTKAIYTYFGAADKIHERLFDSQFDVIGLDFTTNDRNWAVLSEFPKDKKLSAGIVDARNTRIETEESLHRALDRVTESVDAERLYVNPNCGLEFLPRENACDKIANMVNAVKSFGRGN